MTTAPRRQATGKPKVIPPGYVTTETMLREIGGTRATLDKLMVQGRMSPHLVDGDNRRWWVLERARAEWAALVRAKATPGRVTRALEARAAGAEPPPGLPAALTSAPPPPPGALPGETYDEARKRLAVADANKREIEVREKRGQLIDKAAVLRVLESAGLALKAELSTLGARLAQPLAAETDARRCREVIDDEARRALEAFVAAVRKGGFDGK